MKLKLEITCNIELPQDSLADKDQPLQQVSDTLKAHLESYLLKVNLSNLNVTVTQV